MTGDTSVSWLLNITQYNGLQIDVFMMIQKAIMMYPDCVMHILAIRTQQSNNTCLFFCLFKHNLFAMTKGSYYIAFDCMILHNTALVFIAISILVWYIHQILLDTFVTFIDLQNKGQLIIFSLSSCPRIRWKKHFL